MSSAVFHRSLLSHPSLLSMTPLLSSSLSLRLLATHPFRSFSVATSTTTPTPSSSSSSSSSSPASSSAPRRSSSRSQRSSSSSTTDSSSPLDPSVELALEQRQHANDTLKKHIFHGQPKTREDYGPLSEFLQKKRSGELFKKDPPRFKEPIISINNRKPRQRIASPSLSTATTLKHSYEPYRTAVAPEGIQLNPSVTKDAPPTKIDIRFSIRRTASDQLPVYHKYNGSYTKITTQVRGFSGDVDQLFSELVKLVGPAVKVEKKQGKIVLNGQHKHTVHRWLTGLGF